MYISYGQFLLFSGYIIHGSKRFTSRGCRVSLDFRILPDNISITKKSLLSNFVSLADVTRRERKLSNKLRQQSHSLPFLEVNVLLYSSHANADVSHDDQRRVISDFCKQNGFKPVRTFSEIHGTDHCPGLVDLLEKYPLTPVVLYSVTSYDLSKPATFTQLSMLEFHRVGAYYALEKAFIEPGFHRAMLHCSACR